ncbi:hypothetical protein HMPREF1986_02865, partial [Oribacterium sp. oral taxon 078 str. F0263]
LPARGAWIEISSQYDEGYRLLSLPARGAWIEIHKSVLKRYNRQSRSPRGERGLKWQREILNTARRGSLPARGAWIE